MNISLVRLFYKGFCLTLLSCITVWGIPTVSQADEPESQIKETVPSTAGRIIVINPETGTIDPSAKTVSPGATQKSAQPTAAGEEFTHHKDGTVTVDFKGKFMKPVYGHIDDNGKTVISHEQERKE